MYTTALENIFFVYGKSITQLVVQSLKWTSSGRASGAQRPYVIFYLCVNDFQLVNIIFL